MLVQLYPVNFIVNQRQKAPAFYKNRPSDVDLSNLSMIPEAPRVSDTYPKSWDWRILEVGQAVMRGMKKVNSDDSAFGSAESTMKDSVEKVYLSWLSKLYARVIFCLFGVDNIYYCIIHLFELISNYLVHH